jgi:hypothetical protein
MARIEERRKIQRESSRIWSLGQAVADCRRGIPTFAATMTLHFGKSGIRAYDRG